MSPHVSRWRPRAATLGLAVLSAVAGSIIFASPASAAGPAYAALGDSYSSGVGTRNYYADSGSCQRSPNAYPVIDANRLGAALTFVACSGARVSDVLNNQLGSLNASTAYVTISIGGNDAGFTDVITRCALPWPWTCWGDIDNANAYIRNTLPGSLNNVYTQIRNRAPNAKVVVVGYPRLFNESDCQQLARISPGEQTAMNATADLLATTIAGRAAAFGFRFVDVRAAFENHQICDSAEWLNGLSDPIGESYHPNPSGQSAGYAPLVEAAMRAAAAKAPSRKV